ncbi:MAG: mechanosensitive ion channel family protein [Pseudomonadota bacterium]
MAAHRLIVFSLLLIFASAVSAAGKLTTPIGVTGSGNSQQESNEVDIPISLHPDEVEAFLAPLSDQQSRQLLIEHLKRVTANANQPELDSANSSVADFIQAVQQRAIEIADATAAHRLALDDLDKSGERIFLNLTDLRGAPAMWDGLRAFVVMVVFGVVAVVIFSQFSKRVEQRLSGEQQSTVWLRLLSVTLRLLLDLTKVVIFTACAYGLSFVFFERFDPMRYFVIAYLSVITVTWGVWTLTRFFLSPKTHSLRLIDMAANDAVSTHRWIVFLVGVTSLAFFTSGLLTILGLKPELLRLYIITAGAIIIAILLVWIWIKRLHVVDAMEARIVAGCSGERLRHSFAQSWYWFASIYLIGLWWIWASNVLLEWEKQAQAAVYSLFVLFVLPFADYLFGALMRLLLQNEARDSEAQARMQDFVRTLQRGLRLVLVVVAFVVLAGAWSTGLYDMVQTDTGSVVFYAAVNIGVTLLLAFLAWEAVKIFIDPHIPEKPAEGVLDLEGDGGGTGGTRSETLLPLFRSFICIVLVVSVVMIVLSSLGVDIAPLLAGAGVIGLAVGFGAQKLVQDIISGIFFLIDDAFRIGEYVQMGELRGTVESISLRSMKLRHHLGMVQTVPFGDISAITNHSRDWIIMKLEFRMPYNTDIEKVRKLIKKLGQEMQQHPDYGQHMLQPLKSQGVLRIEDSTLIMRMKFTSVPGQQWVIRREAYRRVQEVFRENGMEFAHRKVLVEAAPGPPIGTGELERAGSAVAEQAVTAAPKKDEP